MSSSILSAQDLSLSLGGRCVVDGVTLALHTHCWTALVGPNGAGKSSLLSMLAGWREPDAGRVELRGIPLTQWSPRARGQAMAWLSQHGDAEGDLSVRDLVRLGRLPFLGLLGTPRPEDEAAVQEALEITETLQLSERANSSIRGLSGGERQRVLLARALAVKAQVLLLDEPTSHLDPPHQAQLVRLIRRQAMQGGCVVSVLHDLNLALAADRIVVMARGRVVADGPAHESALHKALTQAFDGAIRIVSMPTEQGTRHLALPLI